MKSGDVNMEIHMRHQILADRKVSVSISNGNSNSSMHLDGAGSDDDSGTDEPQPISLKKAPLLPLRMAREHNGDHMSRGSPALDLCGNNRDTNNGEDHHHHDDDECSGPVGKEGGVSTSFTSGEVTD